MKVLLVDDHPLILSALQTMIHRLDPAVTVLSAENAVDGFELLARQPDVGLVLLDLDLGDEVDGFTVLAEMRSVAVVPTLVCVDLILLVL